MCRLHSRKKTGITVIHILFSHAHQLTFVFHVLERATLLGAIALYELLLYGCEVRRVLVVV